MKTPAVGIKVVIELDLAEARALRTVLAPLPKEHPTDPLFKALNDELDDLEGVNA